MLGMPEGCMPASGYVLLRPVDARLPISHAISCGRGVKMPWGPLRQQQFASACPNDCSMGLAREVPGAYASVSTQLFAATYLGHKVKVNVVVN